MSTADYEVTRKKRAREMDQVERHAERDRRRAERRERKRAAKTEQRQAHERNRA